MPILCSEDGCWGAFKYQLKSSKKGLTQQSLLSDCNDLFVKKKNYACPMIPWIEAARLMMFEYGSILETRSRTLNHALSSSCES